MLAKRQALGCLQVQGCPEVTAHGDIASYSARLHRLLSCQIKEIFIRLFKVNREKRSNIDNCMSKWPPNEGIFSQNFLGEDPQTPLRWVVNSPHLTRLLQLRCCLLQNLRTTLPPTQWPDSLKMSIGVPYAMFSF